MYHPVRVFQGVSRNFDALYRDRVLPSLKPRIRPSTHLHTCRATFVAATCRIVYAHTCLVTNPCCNLSQFVFCDQIQMSLVTRSEWVTKCDDIQNRHVFASVYDICNGIREIANSSCVSQATTCVGCVSIERNVVQLQSFGVDRRLSMI